VTIHEPLNVRVQVRLRLLDSEESVITLSIRYEPIEFEAFQS
jgi:hypothetical protein